LKERQESRDIFDTHTNEQSKGGELQGKGRRNQKKEAPSSAFVLLRLCWGLAGSARASQAAGCPSLLVLAVGAWIVVGAGISVIKAEAAQRQAAERTANKASSVG
jgi:hypothetical protein